MEGCECEREEERCLERVGVGSLPELRSCECRIQAKDEAVSMEMPERSGVSRANSDADGWVGRSSKA